MTPAAATRRGLSTRVVVLCQRHPWMTSLAVALAIGAATGPWTLGLLERESPETVMTLLMLIPAASAFLAHAGRGGRTTSDRLAPWLAANVVVLAAAEAYAELGPWGIRWTAALIVLAPFAFWPLVSAVLLPGDPPGDETPAALIGYPATLALFPGIVARVLGGEHQWAVATAWCLAIVPLAVHAVVRCRLPTGTILLVACLLGAVSYALRQAQLLLAPSVYSRERREMLPFLPILVWVAGALMAVAARRCRSMTAVPLDHPVVEDFGGA